MSQWQPCKQVLCVSGFQSLFAGTNSKKCESIWVLRKVNNSWRHTRVRSCRKCHCWACVQWRARLWDRGREASQAYRAGLFKWHLASAPKWPIDMRTVCRMGSEVFKKQQTAPTGSVRQLWMHLMLHIWWSVAAQSPCNGVMKAYREVCALLRLLKYLIFNPDFWKEQHKSLDEKKILLTKTE